MFLRTSWKVQNTANLRLLKRKLFLFLPKRVAGSIHRVLQKSDFGRALASGSGIEELMDDLGHALADARGTMRMLGGGNPAHIPAVQEVWRHRMSDLLADGSAYDRMLANYDPPAGNTAFRDAVAGLLEREYGWPVTRENVVVTAGGQTAFFYLFNLLAGQFAEKKTHYPAPSRT